MLPGGSGACRVAGLCGRVRTRLGEVAPLPGFSWAADGGLSARFDAHLGADLL